MSDLHTSEEAREDQHPTSDDFLLFVEHRCTEAQHQRIVDHLKECAACQEAVAEVLFGPRTVNVPAPELHKPSGPPGARKESPIFKAIQFVVMAGLLIALASSMFTHRGDKKKSWLAILPPAPKEAPAKPSAKEKERTKPEPSAKPMETLTQKISKSFPAPKATAPQPKDNGRARVGSQTARPTGNSKVPSVLKSLGSTGGREHSTIAKLNSSDSSSMPTWSFPSAEPAPLTRSANSARPAAPKTRSVPGPASDAQASTGQSNPVLWRIVKGQLASSKDGRTWRPVTVDAANPALKLHAVDAGLAGVWVAGDKGALYRLTDRQLWERVVPRAEGAVLTADLVRVHFDDALHGMVLTAAGEQWSTSDGAQSWNRSPRKP